ncbi:DUF433 domain-containing protein [bacterium]|nr:DUF433 domain-containing protein [bacterium]OIO86441.1 MAG: hypothetical protein AUK02_05910 [Anaerolineae bacterium CG2_30_58_95]PIU90826.1 MAG: hypothetical protein COS63_02415 [Anaerolineae bacterium CG06_land_8_20_14_3_00_57_67]PIW18789.1 MAG: hypothetical protein COW33_05530 [Anaerolineae bacterium CG17_big_fil_post_rev_8_21_14_2_50_57_27]PIZ25722.1 MAG: hypothetical protein COY47_04415 [Chloroflexi bacterium CG_4_10_14_0_8_um_filter_57_5]PJH75552.1 MAG: hypothetical protein CO064_0604
MVEIAPGITVDPSVRFGRPVIRGTRVPVETVVGRIAAGMSFANVADEYGITADDIYNALRYAAHRLAEEQVWATA